MTFLSRVVRAFKVFALGACAANVIVAAAAAQENAGGPPPPLEFPFQASPETPRGLAIQIIRYMVETSADFGLCKGLMTNDGKAMPRDAGNEEYCPPDYAAKVRNGEGPIKWADNARPLKCGASCVGRPFMSAETNLSNANLRRAMLYGNLTFYSTTASNRTIRYPYEAYFTCKTQNGSREGDLAIDFRFSPPVIGDPEFWETIGSFFTGGAWSDVVDREIKKRVPLLPNIGQSQGRCRSVGVDLGDTTMSDIIRYDLPGGAGAAASPASGALAGSVATLKDTATVRLLSVTRQPLPPTIPAEFARPGDPFAAQFALFLNGQKIILPSQDLVLPPEGGTAQLNYCKTIGVDGNSTLQILFTNDLGGAVWSQFPRGASFGAGGTRKMTTIRTILLPALGGPPDPLTGRPRPGGKPQAFPLREFELTYEVTFNKAPALSADPAPRPVRRRFGRALTDARPDLAGAERAPAGTATPACKPL